MDDKKIASYYRKPIALLGEMKPGDYVFDYDANLCYVDEDYVLHHYAIESYKSKDSIVYPLSLETEQIMRKMRRLRDRYNKDNIMNAKISRELEGNLHELMLVDVDDEHYGEKMRDIWKRLEARYQELRGHAVALGICRETKYVGIWE